VDAKALLDWLVSNYGYSRDLWVTRFEVGSEIDDNTSGSVAVKNITFEVNGTSKTIELAP
jgi:alpha/beta superfamily hydrolase